MQKYFIYEIDLRLNEDFINFWAPYTTRDGKRGSYYWDNIRDIKRGDIIYFSNQYGLLGKAVASVDSFDVTHEELYGIPVPKQRNWSEKGSAVEANPIFYERPILLREKLNDIFKVVKTGYGFPYSSDRKIKQGGYCFKINDDFVNYIEKIVNESKSYYVVDNSRSEEQQKEEQSNIAKNISTKFKEIDIPTDYQAYIKKEPKFKGKYGTDFPQRNKNQIIKGEIGEEAVLFIEMEALAKNGREDLIKEIIRASKNKDFGDGCGYDIMSFDIDKDGNIIKKYIEVKSTTLGPTTPFDISVNEVDFSRIHANEYYIYRLSNILTDEPKLFVIKGSVTDNFNLIPTGFKAYKAIY